ncbi:MAG: hypothetical protein QGH63_01660, partial [Rhodospirillales bacterium]|nr:hypothetical protein [Rhodospirillales bacterium]
QTALAHTSHDNTNSRLSGTAPKIIVEPSGAVALAAALSGKINTQDKTVGIICTGGNVDATTFKDVLNGEYD